MTPPRVKVCCIQTEAEAGLAVRCGASAVGLVSAMPSGPGVIPDDRIAQIAGVVPPGVATFLLTSRQDAPATAEQQRRCRTTTVPVCAVRVPVFLAGGLTATNVTEAITAVEPFGLDLCSGVRTGGRLDSARFDAFMEAVWRTG